MPELSLLYGPAHPDKIQPLLQTCLERIRQRQGDSFLFLVPTRGQAEQLQQNLLCKSDADLFLKPYILGLEDFIRTLYHACPGRLALLPEVGQQLLIEDTLRHNSRFFNYFSSTQREPFSGLSLALARFVRDLKTAGITPDDLAACRADLPGLAGDKGEELVQIYRHFQQGLGKDFTDLSGMLHSIATHLDEERFRACFPRIDLFLISGFDAFAPPLLRVLVQLLDFIPESCIALDYVPERPRLFGPARDTFAWLRKRATQKTISTATSPNAPLAALESHLFTSPAPPQKACMEIVPCADRLTEIKKIARRIRYLWNAGPLELARVRVACRHIDLYAPLIQEVFPRYGLRFHLAQGYPLPRSPVVVSILAVLDVVLERYSRPALLRLLKLPYIEFKYKMEGRDQTLSAAVVDTWTRTLPPTSGRVEWLQAIDLRCAQLERELANIRRGDLFSDELDDPDKWVEQGREERHKLQALRRGLEDLFTALVPMEQRLDLARLPPTPAPCPGAPGFVRPPGLCCQRPRATGAHRSGHKRLQTLLAPPRRTGHPGPPPQTTTLWRPGNSRHPQNFPLSGPLPFPGQIRAGHPDHHPGGEPQPLLRPSLCGRSAGGRVSLISRPGYLSGRQ